MIRNTQDERRLMRVILVLLAMLVATLVAIRVHGAPRGRRRLPSDGGGTGRREFRTPSPWCVVPGVELAAIRLSPRARVCA